LNNPYSIIFDSSDNLYIADSNNQRVRKVSTSGLITTIAGTGSIGNSGDNGPATLASFFNPIGIILDNIGNLYIVDNGNEVIRKINNAGIISTAVGSGFKGFDGDNGPATSAKLDYPTGITFDTDFNLYVSDSDNQRIRKVATSGINILLLSIYFYNIIYFNIYIYIYIKFI
jgi:sugar lactone lactonase YvrE